MTASYTERRPGTVLETLPGKVHGIVGVNPYEVQCDGCLVVRSSPTKALGAQIMLTDILFWPRRYDTDQRRLCGDCRAVEWPDCIA